MAINGCLTLAWLEEDDPSRGFFRVKPAAIIGAIPEVYSDGGTYGEEGFLRVVPDKNEMSTFKMRMRTLGRLCFIDLRQHPRENDKIRQNKNYVIGSDRNPYMIYSDVIREVPEGMICEIRSDAVAGAPVTTMVYKREPGGMTGPYRDENDEWVACTDCAAHTDEQCAARVAELEDTQGGHVSLIFTGLEDVDGLVLAPLSEFVPEHDVRPRIVQPDDNGLLPGFTNKARPAPAAPVAAVVAPPVTQPEAAAAAPEPAPEPAPEIPRENGMPYALKLLRDQMGLNPRKGRSLSEVVDEQWRMRKQDELGQSVPPLAESEPVMSPAETAIKALDDAWQYQGAQAPLIEGIIANEELVQRLYEVYRPDAKQHASDAAMIELEAERLKFITEIDGLKRRTREMKAEVLRELKTTNEIDADALRNSIVLLDEEIDARKARLTELDAERETLENAVKQALDKPVAQRMAEMLADSKLKELLSIPAAASAPADVAAQPAAPVTLKCPLISEAEEAPEEEKVTLAPEELIDRLSMGMKNRGWKLRRDDVVHIIAVLALNRPLALSGFTGQDDACFARCLGETLGDAQLELCWRMNAQSDENIIEAGRGVYSVLDYPEGLAVSARMLDACFVVRDASGLCLPGEAPQLPALNENSYAALRAFTLSAAAGDRLERFAAKLAEYGARVSRGAFADCAAYIAAAGRFMSGGEDMALDYALAYRLLPPVLVTADAKVLRALPGLCEGMPECKRMLHAPLHIAAEGD